MYILGAHPPRHPVSDQSIILQLNLDEEHATLLDSTYTMTNKWCRKIYITDHTYPVIHTSGMLKLEFRLKFYVFLCMISG